LSEKSEAPKIGTWPTPERIALAELALAEMKLESLLFMDKVEIAPFLPKLCKALEDSMRSDIGCLYKYINANLCTEPKIKECLTRLVRAYILYQRYCCRRG